MSKTTKLRYEQTMRAKYKLAEIFGRISPTYELVNHLLTFGFDLSWRQQASRLAQNFNGSLWVDICTGPGDMAQALARQPKSADRILAMDFCWPMLLKLKKKKRYQGLILPIMAQADELPLVKNSVDLITLAFATRNLFPSHRDLLNSFREFYRVLRPHGHFLNLETSQPQSDFIRKVFHLYVKVIVRLLGTIVSGNRPAYDYLSSSICRFLPAEELTSLLFEAGFSKVKVLPLTQGVVTIHLATK